MSPPASRPTSALRPAAGALAAGAALAVLAGARAVQETSPPLPQAASGDAAFEALSAAFAAAGIQVDRDSGSVAFPVRVEILNELLEYLIVGSHGAAHESLFVTDVDAEVLHAAVLAVGVEPGRNVEYVAKDPPPTRDEVRAGAQTHDVVLPSGGEVYLYALWREFAGQRDLATGEFPAETLHFHRVEDLMLDLVRGRTMRRHPWVWLGSRMIPGRRADGPEEFAATATGNLANVSFFSMGDTLVTAALPECTSQTSWRPNVWMLPDRGTEVLFLVSRSPLEEVPQRFTEAIPFAPEPAPEVGQGDAPAGGTGR